VAGASQQSSGAVSTIRLAAGALPAVFIVVAIAIMAKYPLTEERFRQLVLQIAERRREQVAA
jgi:glucuronide carrier protein